jgi:DMSO reductase family type II enzyme molybdopterin subunit
VAPRFETDAALGLALAQVIVSEGLFDADYVREQTDLPFLIREDTGRFLRGSDLRSGGVEDLLYFWDESSGGLRAAPGCEGHGGRKLALGKAVPALEGRWEVDLAGGETVEVRPGFERLREHLEGYTPEMAADTTGVSASVVRRMARDLAAAPRAMIFASWGSCKHYHSDLFQRSMMLLMALTGNQGKSGGGVRVAAWWAVEGFSQMAAAEPHISWRDKLRIFSKVIRGMTPRDFEGLFTDFTKRSAVVPLMPFLYEHGGYRELWSRPDLADPAQPRPFDAYVQEAVERGWIPIHPPRGRHPRVFTFTGSNPLRRWPAPQYARKGLWPKLDLVVAMTFRMTTSAMWADYVLPCAAYYEKHGIKYAQTYVPYLMVCEKAVEPLGEAKTEWETFGRLVERVAQRARARGIREVEGPNGEPLDLGGVYDHWSKGGHFDPDRVEDVLDEMLRATSITGGVGREEAFRVGAVRIVKPGPLEPLHQTASDYDPEDTYWPHRWFVEDKLAWPTLTGRQQFYIDHPWYMEAGEAFPVHKASPGAASGLPLRLSGGHTRWSVHAIWRDHELMLRLQRGEPACFLNAADAGPRGIRDGDRVRVRNETGSFEAQVRVAAGVQPGLVIIYHAWEPYQFKGWKGQQEPVEAPWKALHLAGDYGQIHYRMYYAAPSHAPRGSAVEVERI